MPKSSGFTTEAVSRRGSSFADSWWVAMTPSDDELDVMARQARASLERLVDIKDREADRKGSVGGAASRPVEVGQRGRVDSPTDDTDWKPRGLCWRVDGRWMDVVNGPAQRESMARELAFCSRCSVSDECLEYGLKEPMGVWGGKLPKERRAIVRERKRLANL